MQRTPLHLSSENGHTEIVNVLLSHGADNNVKDEVSKMCYVFWTILIYNYNDYEIIISQILVEFITFLIGYCYNHGKVPFI